MQANQDNGQNEANNIMDMVPGEQLSEQEQYQRLKEQTKGNICYHLSWCFLAILIIMQTPHESCGLHVKTLLMIRMAIRVFYSLPCRLYLFYLAQKKIIPSHSVPVITSVAAVPLVFWYIYIATLLFNHDNDCRSKSFPLFMGFLLLAIESVLYLVMLAIIGVLL